jgi:hypothetical protein
VDARTITGVEKGRRSACLSAASRRTGHLAHSGVTNNVASAREKGWSWQQIGDALGVTRQSVHTKYNKESS